MQKRNVKLILTLLLVIILTSCSGFHKETEIPEPDGNYYIDKLDVLSDKSKEYINKTSKEIENKNGTQVFVLTIDNLTEDPHKFATEAFNKYQLGDKEKQNGLLIMIARRVSGKRRVEVITGYGLEELLPDGRVGRIIDNYMLEDLKADNYDKGIRSGYNKFTEIVSDPENNIHWSKTTVGSIFNTIILFIALPIIASVAITGSIIRDEKKKKREYQKKYDEYSSVPFNVLFDEAKKEVSETSKIQWNNDGSFTDLQPSIWSGNDEILNESSVDRVRSDSRWLDIPRILADRIVQDGLPPDLELPDYRIIYSMVTPKAIHDSIIDICTPVILDIYDLKEVPNVTLDYLLDIADKYKSAHILLDKHIIYKYFYDLEDNLPEEKVAVLNKELEKLHLKNPDGLDYDSDIIIHPLTRNLLGMIPYSYNKDYVDIDSGLYETYTESDWSSGDFFGGGGFSGGGGAGRDF